MVENAIKYYEEGDESVLPKSIASRQEFLNAMTLDIAMGGSSNTVLHLLAVANEAGVGFGLLFRKLFLPSGGASPVYFLRNYGVLLAVSILCCTPLIEKIWNALRKHTVTRVAAVLVLLVLSTAYVVGSTNSPFLYFNF